MREIQRRYQCYFRSLIDELQEFIDELGEFIDELKETHKVTRRWTDPVENYCTFFQEGGIAYIAKFSEENEVLAYVRINENVRVNRLKLHNALKQRKEEIESALGSPLKFRDDREKSSLIIVSRPGGNIMELSDDELRCIRRWHIYKLLRLRLVFGREIRREIQQLHSTVT